VIRLRSTESSPCALWKGVIRVGTMTVMSMGILNELVLCINRERLLSARREYLLAFDETIPSVSVG